MRTTHGFKLTQAQIKALIAEKFGIPNPDEMTVVTVDEVSEDNWSLLDELEVEFSAPFKDAAKVAKRVERFQGKVDDGEE